jgi:aspartate-semialdehyde dehydrogenase
MECVSVRLTESATPAQVVAAFEGFRGEPQELGLPSAPPQPVVVRTEPNRPQPILDREDGSMASVVGRVRECPVMGIKFVVLGHNTVRGAAGASVLNAEYFKVKGLLPS